MYIIKAKTNSEIQEISTADRTLLSRWRVSTFWVCLVGYIGYYLCRANFPAAFPILSETFHYTNSELGVIAALSEATYALGKFTMGPLTDRLGGRKIFLVGMAGGVLLNVAFSLCSTILAFTVVWCLCRFFLSMGWGGLTKMIGHWYPPERNGTIMGVISINFQFGGVLGTMFAGYLVSLNMGWRSLFYGPALATFLIFVWSYFFSRDRPRDVITGAELDLRKSHKKQLLKSNDDQTSEHVDVLEIVKSLLTMPLFQKLLLFSFIAHILRSFFFFWTAKFLVDIGMGASNAIFNSALFPLFGCLGTILLGWYTDRGAKSTDRARPMWIMLVGLSACLALITFYTQTPNPADHFKAIVVLLSASGFLLLAPYSMTAGALTLDIAGARGAGTSSGLIDGTGYLGGALATWATGLLADRLGWSQVFLFLSFFGLIAAFAAFLMSRGFQQATRDARAEKTAE